MAGSGLCISDDYVLAQAINNDEVTRSSASQKRQLQFDETEMVATEKSINHEREHVKKTTELTDRIQYKNAAAILLTYLLLAEEYAAPLAPLFAVILQERGTVKAEGAVTRRGHKARAEDGTKSNKRVSSTSPAHVNTAPASQSITTY